MLAKISKAKFDFEIIESNLPVKEIAVSLADVGLLYPGFKNWLYFTFRAGMINNQRKIIVAHQNGEVAGLSLLKNTVEEKKICTFYVLPEFRGYGLGGDLMSKSLQILDRNGIEITVSEERHEELSPLLSSSGFTLVSVKSDYYRNGKDEIFYKL
ncbi:GNAT family N-acetyltransferase [Pseudomonas putida]|uniref:GNAT family N-acetyltransferase n=1 Tax=Pseudomonas putida TaxID=303 RepID=UPI0013789CC7|nr:GNAT family N-acetyltransferase [Pseudomonas putida]